MITKKQIGLFLKEERRRQNKSQRLLSEESGLRRQAVIEMENDDLDFGVSALLKYCKALDVNISFSINESKRKIFDFSKISSNLAPLKTKQ